MRYTFVNGTDYRSDNISAGVKYQLQAIHMTKVHHYNDTLDMLVVSKDPMKTSVRVSVCVPGAIKGVFLLTQYHGHKT